MAWFSPTRLTIARQRRSLSKKALADTLRLSPTSLANYEDGKRTPPSELIDQFVFALRFPRGFFFAPELEDLPPEYVTFRARRALTAITRDRTLASGRIAGEIISPAFRSRYRLPEVDVPDLSRETPEGAARMLRSLWGLGQAPIDNVVHLLETRGVDVFWLEDDSPCLDAVSFWRGSRPFVMMNVGKSGERGRYDAAHELGHLVLHKQARTTDPQEIEDQANRFASAFLLPAEQFRLECPKRLVLSELLEQKSRWKVSVAAMVVRGHDLGIYTDRSYQHAFRQMASRGWRTGEPNPIPRETSLVHAQIFDKLVAKGMTSGQLSELLQLHWDDIVELTPDARKLEVAKSAPRFVRVRPSHIRVIPGGVSETDLPG